MDHKGANLSLSLDKDAVFFIVIRRKCTSKINIIKGSDLGMYRKKAMNERKTEQASKRGDLPEGGDEGPIIACTHADA